MLFEGPAPSELAEWVKTIPAPSLPPLQPGYPNGSRRGQGYPTRSYLPQGIYVQDPRGPILCRPLACIVEGDWIFPVRENAIACLQSRAEEPARVPPP